MNIEVSRTPDWRCGLDGFVVLSAAEPVGEVELLVESTEAVTGPRCGVVAEPHGRRPVNVRDLRWPGGQRCCCGPSGCGAAAAAVRAHRANGTDSDPPPTLGGVEPLKRRQFISRTGSWNRQCEGGASAPPSARSAPAQSAP
jgi:hypothetical protein